MTHRPLPLPSGWPTDVIFRPSDTFSAADIHSAKTFAAMLLNPDQAPAAESLFSSGAVSSHVISQARLHALHHSAITAVEARLAARRAAISAPLPIMSSNMLSSNMSSTPVQVSPSKSGVSDIASDNDEPNDEPNDDEPNDEPDNDEPNDEPDNAAANNAEPTRSNLAADVGDKTAARALFKSLLNAVNAAEHDRYVLATATVGAGAEGLSANVHKMFHSSGLLEAAAQDRADAAKLYHAIDDLIKTLASPSAPLVPSLSKLEEHEDDEEDEDAARRRQAEIDAYKAWLTSLFGHLKTLGPILWGLQGPGGPLALARKDAQKLNSHRDRRGRKPKKDAKGPKGPKGPKGQKRARQDIAGDDNGNAENDEDVSKRQAI